MTLLDTGILTLAFLQHPRVSQRAPTSPETPVISFVSRIEVLHGRFDSVLKASDPMRCLLLNRGLPRRRRI